MLGSLLLCVAGCCVVLVLKLLLWLGIRLVGFVDPPFVVGRAGEWCGGRLAGCVAGATLGVAEPESWNRTLDVLSFLPCGKALSRCVLAEDLLAYQGECVLRLGLKSIFAGISPCSTIQPTTHPDGGTAGQKCQCRPSTGHRPLNAVGRRGPLLVCVRRTPTWYARHVPKNAASGRGWLERRVGSGEG